MTVILDSIWLIIIFLIFIKILLENTYLQRKQKYEFKFWKQLVKENFEKKKEENRNGF